MGKKIKHGSRPTPVANGCGGHSQSPPLYSHSGTPPRRQSLSVFRFCIKKFTSDEVVTNLCTLSFTFGTTCTHKSVLVNNWLFVEFGMLVVVDENGEMFHLVFLFIPHLMVQLRFKSDLFPRNALRATPRFCPLFTRTGS